ncbi:MetQ/NlpA family ABC transporter substrate-binding protein [Devosia sp. 1566]|uniref:MetQ/NlpA family ABC transporter substrate-binding protein n=1 Tax=Devosia sp. 1566 TaxID=2499144 RepID=UPI000FDC3435|nr:MetQ/NlpA family ABC transporter substrate-binding protein [Devosia sp. 1566]
MTKTFLPALALAVTLSAAPAFAETYKIGVTPGPHAQILEAVQEVLAPKGIELEITEFSDYVVPNEALASGELDANSFQHQPYLDNQIKDRGYDIVSVATTVNFPIGIYSEKIDSIEDLPEGGSIAIPNDPTNGGRVLLLLQENGVIKLKDGVGTAASVADIVDNPKNLQILEIDAAQLPRTLPDVDAAGINTNYAEQAGLDPVNGAILREGPEGPYVNIIAVRSEDKDAEWVKALVEAYHSDEIKQFVDTTFNGAVLASW